MLVPDARQRSLLMKRSIALFASLPRVVLSLGAAALLGSLAVPAHGAIITVGGLVTVTADDGASFKAGDQFTYSFTFDDQTVDNATETFNARFNAGVSAFSLSRGGANVGTWDPAAGTFDVAPVMNFIAGANSDTVTIQATGSGFPAMNGQPFFDVGLSFSFSGVQDFVDTGSGQTFAQVVGVSPLDFATASSTFAEIRNTSFGSPTLTMTVAPVPEPSTYAMALAGLACGGYSLKRRRRAR
jgi:hypothetical protein